MDQDNRNIKILSHAQIMELGLSAQQCNEWINQAFLCKSESILKPKISLKPADGVFFNTMPVAIPSIQAFGTKVVSRFPEQEPSLTSQIFIYNLINGHMQAILDGTWITAMRTGAVAALAAQTFAIKQFSTISFIGLGNTARATLMCLAALYPKQYFNIRLRAYKDQADKFIKAFGNSTNLNFEVVDDNKSLIVDSDVVFSCVTVANEQIGEDSWYKEGVVVIPVHTLGFQNCDLFFDKVFVDDIGHVKDFKYYNKFKYTAELSDVLTKTDPGRTNNKERILCYNIGIALHDIYFAKKIIDSIKVKTNVIDLPNPDEKFWLKP